jgi:hypothetical protein
VEFAKESVLKVNSQQKIILAILQNLIKKLVTDVGTALGTNQFCLEPAPTLADTAS